MTVTIHTPQLICTLLLGTELIIATILHGTSKGTYNIFITFFDVIITFGLLYWGGFFSCL